MKPCSLAGVVTLCILLVCSCPMWAQKDPGVRGGIHNTGGGLQQQGIPIPHPPLISPNPATGATVNDNERLSFEEGILRAGQLESTCDDCADVTDGSPVVGKGELDPVFPQFHTNSNGLGARHNADQCFVCHAQPNLGGSGGFIVPNPGPGKPQPAENPQFHLVPHRYSRQNTVPSFEKQFGPIREVRFKYNPDGTRDGGVHQLWTVRGSTNDQTIPNCALTQPDFDAEARANNLAFRIPLQMMGLGLIESIQDREILNQHDATASLRIPLGITGHPNRSGNDGTIARFGWKAQNKSITVFAGEAYNVEQGITNEVFPNATEEDPDCQGPKKPEPNDVTRTDSDDSKNQWFDNPMHILPDWMQFQVCSCITWDRGWRTISSRARRVQTNSEPRLSGAWANASSSFTMDELLTWCGRYRTISRPPRRSILLRKPTESSNSSTTYLQATNNRSWTFFVPCKRRSAAPVSKTRAAATDLSHI